MTTTMLPGHDYRPPTKPTLQRNRTTRHLYHLERHAIDAIKDAAAELGHLLRFGHDELYTHALPETLTTLLDSIDTSAAILAAAAYLEHLGYTITPRPVPQAPEARQPSSAD